MAKKRKIEIDQQKLPATLSLLTELQSLQTEELRIERLQEFFQRREYSDRMDDYNFLLEVYHQRDQLFSEELSSKQTLNENQVQDLVGLFSSELLKFNQKDHESIDREVGEVLGSNNSVNLSDEDARNNIVMIFILDPLPTIVNFIAPNVILGVAKNLSDETLLVGRIELLSSDQTFKSVFGTVKTSDPNINNDEQRDIFKKHYNAIIQRAARDYSNLEEAAELSAIRSATNQRKLPKGTIQQERDLNDINNLFGRLGVSPSEQGLADMMSAFKISNPDADLISDTEENQKFIELCKNLIGFVDTDQKYETFSQLVVEDSIILQLFFASNNVTQPKESDLIYSQIKISEILTFLNQLETNDLISDDLLVIQSNSRKLKTIFSLSSEIVSQMILDLEVENQKVKSNKRPLEKPRTPDFTGPSFTRFRDPPADEDVEMTNSGEAAVNSDDSDGDQEMAQTRRKFIFKPKQSNPAFVDLSLLQAGISSLAVGELSVGNQNQRWNILLENILFEFDLITTEEGNLRLAVDKFDEFILKVSSNRLVAESFLNNQEITAEVCDEVANLFNNLTLHLKAIKEEQMSDAPLFVLEAADFLGTVISISAYQINEMRAWADMPVVILHRLFDVDDHSLMGEITKLGEDMSPIFQKIYKIETSLFEKMLDQAKYLEVLQYVINKKPIDLIANIRIESIPKLLPILYKLEDGKLANQILVEIEERFKDDVMDFDDEDKMWFRKLQKYNSVQNKTNPLIDAIVNQDSLEPHIENIKALFVESKPDFFKAVEKFLDQDSSFQQSNQSFVNAVVESINSDQNLRPAQIVVVLKLYEKLNVLNMDCSVIGSVIKNISKTAEFGMIWDGQKSAMERVAALLESNDNVLMSETQPTRVPSPVRAIRPDSSAQEQSGRLSPATDILGRN